MKKISLIVPFYNEEQGIDAFFSRLSEVLHEVQHHYQVEVICINDGSKDGTLAKLLQYQSANIRIVDFSRNFGKEAAITAGFDFVQGDAAIVMDADLQHPPELLIKMLEQWQQGFDVVLAKRCDRSSDRFLQKMAARAFYEVTRYISAVNIPDKVGDFRLLDRAVVEALKSLRESCRFMKGIFAWVGFKVTEVEYQHTPRLHGKTKFNTWKLWNFALDGITSFSTVPLRIWTYIGGGISLLSGLYAIYLIIRTLAFGVDSPGYASLMVAILFLSGIQLIGIGVLGEYVGRIFIESKRRPLYIIKKVYTSEI
jgi:glycosyltransferase involved in cell wall biosynthesis